MSKHTQGPWSWYQPSSSPSTNPYCAAFVLGPKRVPFDKAEGFTVADASLIAAAPDLLEALELITNIYSAMRESLSVKYANDGWSAVTMSIDQARKAIARAKGESV